MRWRFVLDVLVWAMCVTILTIVSVGFVLGVSRAGW